MTIQEDNEKKYLQAWKEYHNAVNKLINFGVQKGDLQKEINKL